MRSSGQQWPELNAFVSLQMLFYSIPMLTHCIDEEILVVQKYFTPCLLSSSRNGLSWNLHWGLSGSKTGTGNHHSYLFKHVLLTEDGGASFLGLRLDPLPASLLCLSIAQVTLFCLMICTTGLALP